MRRNGQAITIHSVAKAAGVSVSTVSRVLNKKVDVAPETVEKVQSVIQELGYASSLAARGLRSHHTNVIGLVVPDVAGLYSVEIMRGVNQAIAQIDKDLIIYTSGRARGERTVQQEQNFVALLNGGIADGVIVVTPTASDFSSHAPVVVIDPNNESPGLPAVISTNYEGAVAAMTYLIGLGHRRIAHITGALSLVSSIQRLQAYKDSLVEAGIPLADELIEFGDYAFESAVKCAWKLLSLKDRPTAIFAANDAMAEGVYKVANDMGLCIPQDLSVVGFDNLNIASMLTPPLTTVDQFVEQMGEVSVKMILMLIRGEELQSNLHIIQTKLIIRNSCAPIQSVPDVN